MKYFAYLPLFVLLLAGCDNAAVGNVVNAQEPYENAEAEVYFCPRDDCDETMRSYIQYAKKSVHCAFFELNLDDLIAALARKSHDADVKVVIDERNYDSQIKGEGVRTAKSEQYMHNKFCVIDNKMVFTGSTNPTLRGANQSNNNLVIISSEYIAKNYEDEFNELWSGICSSGENVKYDKINTDKGVIENYFCPEDCQDGVHRVIELVKSANKSIQVAIFSFTHEELADEFIKADIKGINVTILVEKRQRNVQNSQYERLKDFGLNIKVDGNKYDMHHKFIVIDNKIVITGSPNFSFSGFNRNDENMLILYNANLALKYRNEFDRMFEEGEVI